MSVGIFYSVLLINSIAFKSFYFEMSELSSKNICFILEELEVIAERATAAVYDASLSHDACIKAAVISGDHASTERTETTLRAARREADRLADVLDQARQLHADALKREHEAGKAKVREEVEAELLDMDKEAAAIDAVFVATVERILKLRTRELALRRKVRDNFSEVSGSPDYIAALRSLAVHLGTTANNAAQNSTPARITMAAAAGTSSVRRVIHGE